MKLSYNLIKKFGWYARTGQNYYLLLSVTFVNFILITYSFLFSSHVFFEKYDFAILVFSFIFIVLYFPISIVIGRWHNKTQTSIDNTIRAMASPILAKMIRVLLDVQTGKATKEEIEEFREFVSKIERLDINEL